MSPQGQVIFILWITGVVICSLFLPKTSKILSDDNNIDGDTRGFLALASIVPFINVIAGLFSLVVCIGKFVEYVYESNKPPSFKN